MKLTKKEKKIAKKLVKILGKMDNNNLDYAIKIGIEENSSPDTVCLLLMEKQYRNLTLEEI